MNIQDHISESLETMYWVKNIGTLILRCGSWSGIPGSFLTLEPGYMIQDGKN
jgi:hypothetical protein